MVFKVFGNTNNEYSKKITNDTIDKIKKLINKDDSIIFYDMDNTDGMSMANTENIYYSPSVICEDEEHEIGYIENKFALQYKNDKDDKYIAKLPGTVWTEDATDDLSRSHEWWKQLKEFIEDMLDIKKEDK